MERLSESRAMRRKKVESRVKRRKGKETEGG
jgi:hypothetical protein